MQHSFHRACLVENRRAGNTGCPYCRGELDQGLTPEPTAAENRAAAEARAISAARGAALDAAVTAMVDVRRLLAAVAEASGTAAVVGATVATRAASATQVAVAGVLTVVRDPEPSLAMYEAASRSLQASRVRLHTSRLMMTVEELREERRAAEEVVEEAEQNVRDLRLAARFASRIASAGAEGRGGADSVDPARARSVGAGDSLLPEALLAVEAAKASLASMESKEEEAVLELAIVIGATERVHGSDGGSSGSP